jgi:hypothetical protein
VRKRKSERELALGTKTVFGAGWAHARRHAPQRLEEAPLIRSCFECTRRHVPVC